ncbi:quinone oxidoreductase family protein [Pusillimonas noertemannii]|uniref:NADPH:quinone reductase-like Zn-dependent oxidoreductase n=1 Tax=Pusillimonas noertemannii TaxID=305977 RepID=A0A2U1CKI7_9BURK|nr:quinone oxidoreductase [Pusillimonas noertemannii]NYT69571.1 quinone oxidoreductase [Pusillimonas noertemannii]PVY61505.1 NADPH:quinone reductase-like Zn-dependent oxidoreductase [Pusillimonas noertemannii]TFL08904.1 quinone oxidoreductase [Pusillimonas noertemannii]
MQTEAIRITRHGGPEVMEMVSQNAPDPAEGEVVIEQKAIGLNFIDIYFRTGLYKHPLPHGLGFEAAGRVAAVGSGVTHLKAGDRVAYAQSPLGAYAGARTMPAWQVVKLPRSVDFESAAAMMLKGLTVQYLFRQTYRLQGGETILFHAAAGGVGLIACQWARALGVRLIGTASSPEKAELAKRHGAWQVIDYSRDDIAKKVLELTDGRKVPVVYDGVGKSTWLASLDCLQPRGLMVSFGNASGPVEGVNLGILAAKGSLYLTRPSITDYTPTRQKLGAAAKDLFDLVSKGKIRMEIGQRFALRDAGKAHEALASRQTTGATVLLPE